MAYFGFDNQHNIESFGEDNAVNAALELRNAFKDIKVKWINIWKTNFGKDIIDLDVKCGMCFWRFLFY